MQEVPNTVKNWKDADCILDQSGSLLAAVILGIFVGGMFIIIPSLENFL